MYKRRNFLLMSALGAALSAGAAAVAAAYDPAAPEFPNDGKLRVKHSETGQVCEFDTAEQLDTFGKGIANHADRDSWQLVQRAIPDGVAAQAGGVHIAVDLEQLRADVAASSAVDEPTGHLTTADDLAKDPLGQRAGLEIGGQLTANGLNPHYRGQFEGETAEQAEARRTAAGAEALTGETNPAAPQEPAALEQPATTNDTAA